MLNNICKSSWKHRKKILKCTDLLFHKFGITYFGIQRITKDGYWSLLTNNPTWVEHSADEQFYQHDPTLTDPNHYKPCISYISANPIPEFRSSLLKSAAEQFDMDNCLSIIIKNNQDSEFAYFATSCSHTEIMNTYISELKLLERFVHYFKSENEEALQEAKENNIDLKQLKPQAYFINPNLLDSSPQHRGHSLDSIFYKLSKREEQCLHWILKGKTAKEIAKMLNISFRTVEEYIGNIKNKTNCNHLHDLFVLFKNRL